MTWIVVGASAGLGRALAERLGRQHRSLILVAGDQRDLAALASDLEIVGGARVRVLAHDAADHAALAERLDGLVAEGEDIEGLLFPVGAMAPDDEGELDPSAAERLMQVNFLCVASVVRRFLPRLERQRSGVVVGFGSVASIRGRGRNVAYAASKRALESYFESLRHRCEPQGLCVVFYSLGYLRTSLSFGQKLPLPSADPSAMAEEICRELGRRRGKHYKPGWWRWIALVVRHLPWFVYGRLRF